MPQNAPGVVPAKWKKFDAALAEMERSHERSAMPGVDQTFAVSGMSGFQDPVDASDYERAVGTKAKEQERLSSVLDQVAHARGKIRDGLYETCEGCEGKIPLSRLRALPYAAYCVMCQSAAEKGGISTQPKERDELLPDFAPGDEEDNVADAKQPGIPLYNGLKRK